MTCYVTLGTSAQTRFPHNSWLNNFGCVWSKSSSVLTSCSSDGLSQHQLLWNVFFVYVFICLPVYTKSWWRSELLTAAWQANCTALRKPFSFSLGKKQILELIFVLLLTIFGFVDIHNWKQHENLVYTLSLPQTVLDAFPNCIPQRFSVWATLIQLSKT